MSHDFEDIVYLLNYTLNFKEEIISSPDEEVKEYLIESFRKILQDDKLQEAIIGNLYFEDQMARFERIMEELKIIVS